MKSGNITVTDGRLLSALNKVTTAANNTTSGGASSKDEGNAVIRTGLVKKFYYNWDRAEVDVDGELIVARLTSPLGYGCSLYFTPFGDLHLDKDRNHTYFNVNPNNRVIVVTVNDSSFIIAYYNDGTFYKPNIARGGVTYLSSYGEHIQLGGTQEGGMVIDGNSLILKNEQYNTDRNVIPVESLTEENVTNMDYYNKEEVDIVIDKLLERIETLEKELGITYESIKTSIISEDLTKYYGDSTPFTAVLEDASGNPLAGYTLKLDIHGVEYTRTTDSDGVVVLNINLTAGEYPISVVFDGDDYYEGVSVSNTVIVKEKA